MVRLAIVEDEEAFLNQLEEYCDRFRNEYKTDLAVSTYRDGDQIVKDYSSQFDIILMDIEMKFMNGMEAAEEIRRIDEKVEILFITNLAQYAIKGYEVGALDYILKPLHYFAFSQKLLRAISRVEDRKESFAVVSVRGGMQRLAISSIYYIESQGHNLIFHTRNEEFISVGTMKAAEQQFTEHHFFRANKGYLINLAKVEAIRDKCAVVKGENLLISRSRYEAFMKAMADFWSERKN